MQRETRVAPSVGDTQRALPVLSVRGLRLHYPGSGSRRKSSPPVKAVDGVDLDMTEGETLGLVGESGCGKTSVGRAIVRAIDPTEGEIHYRKADGSVVDIAGLRGRRLHPLREDIRMIFQDPYASLNPRMTLLDIIGEPLKIARNPTKADLREVVGGLLQRVGLRREYMDRYPHAFSGGERQRVGIARTLSLDPRVVVADEAVSALDVSVRAQILDLLCDLRDERGLTYLFIAHDLAVVEQLCDRVAVMYVGKIVENATTEQLFSKPLHPYTEALLSAVPSPDPRSRFNRERIRLHGDVADPADPPAGCYFHPRCPYAEQRCREEEPRLRDLGEGRTVACHFAEELKLQGASPTPAITMPPLPPALAPPNPHL